EPARQLQGFLRAVRALAAVAVPVCVLQAAVAGPVVRLIFSPRADPGKWYAAIPVLQVLSLGMAFKAVGMPTSNLLQAQGRFKLYLKLTAVYAAVFLVMVALAAALSVPERSALAVAVAVAITFAVLEPMIMHVAVRRAGGGWRDVASACFT